MNRRKRLVKEKLQEPRRQTVESLPDLGVAQGITPGIIPPESSIIPELDIPIGDMGVIQLHALIRSWSGTPRYAKYHNLLDVYNRAELQQKVAEAMEE